MILAALFHAKINCFPFRGDTKVEWQEAVNRIRRLLSETAYLLVAILLDAFVAVVLLLILAAIRWVLGLIDLSQEVANMFEVTHGYITFLTYLLVALRGILRIVRRSFS